MTAPAVVWNGPTPKDRSRFLKVLRRYIEQGKVSTDGEALVVGATDEDAEVLRQAGWSRMTLSTFPGEAAAQQDTSYDGRYLVLDVENMHLRDASYDVVVAHEVLHHCRSPHRALCEMLRVSRRYVLFQEPNDCFLSRLNCRLGLALTYEIPAVVAHDFVAGGVRNSGIPNFVARWTLREAEKVARSFIPEKLLHVHGCAYWELNATEYELGLRQGTTLGKLVALAGGPRNFQRVLRFAERILNLLPITRHQGNRFLCCIEKTGTLQPWLRDEGTRLVFHPAQGRG